MRGYLVVAVVEFVVVERGECVCGRRDGRTAVEDGTAMYWWRRDGWDVALGVDCSVDCSRGGRSRRGRWQDCDCWLRIAEQRQYLLELCLQRGSSGFGGGPVCFHLRA